MTQYRQQLAELLVRRAQLHDELQLNEKLVIQARSRAEAVEETMKAVVEAQRIAAADPKQDPPLAATICAANSR